MSSPELYDDLPFDLQKRPEALDVHKKNTVARSMEETLKAYERLPLYKRREHAKTMGWPIPEF